MKNDPSQKLVLVNLAFWLVAMLLHPLSRLLPSESGRPAKIWELLIPILFILLASGSTYLLQCAIPKKPSNRDGD